MRKSLVLSLVLLSACGGRAPEQGAQAIAPSRSPVIYTVNYPLAWMAQELVDDAATVVFPAPEGVDPAVWEPDIESVQAYQQADLILLNGAGYAKWTTRVSLPSARLRDTSVSYAEQLLAVTAGPVHSHGPGGEHSHSDLAFTTWLDLELARLQAAAVAQALQQLMPDESSAIERRLAILQQALGGMDEQLIALGKQYAGTPLLYSHPVYQYLHRRYQFNGRALHWEPDQTPDESQWSELEHILRTHPASIMLWEAPPLPDVRARLAELGVEVVVFAPLGNRPLQADFESAMRANITALDEVAP